MSAGTLAVASGGDLEMVSTWKTYLSSRCLCGLRRKKTRSEHNHICGCAYVPEGTYVDRDEFSAFLAMFSQGSALDEVQARAAWTAWGADCRLRSASKGSQVAPGKVLPSRRARGMRKGDSTEHGYGQRREAGAGKKRTGERRGINPPKIRQPRRETEGSHVA